MIRRTLEPTLTSAIAQFPVVALVGPRQVGKTTLAKSVERKFQGAIHLDLERPTDLFRLSDPELFLSEKRKHLVVIDEVQRRPDLFPLLRALVDEDRRPGRFLLLGSASPDLINRSSESLAGRIRTLEMTPLTLREVGATPANLRRLWLRGGFPDSYLAPTDDASSEWREAFVRTYLERDLPGLGFRLPAASMGRFWRMLAHLHGQSWNASALARSLDVSPQTAGRYLDALGNAFMVRRLPPFHANLGKRLVKSPRVYLRDSGILHSLAGISSFDDLESHPLLGASWEGFVVEQILGMRQGTEAFYHRTAAGSEVDLVLPSKGRRPPVAIEVKYSSAPKLTKGFWQALDDLKIERAFVVHPGKEPIPIESRVTAWPAVRLSEMPIDPSPEHRR